MKKIFFNLLLLSSFTLANNIIVSISPVEYFVKQIAKNKMKVEVLFPEANFDYSYRKLELISLAKAKVYFTIGLKEEEKYKNLLLTYNPSLPIVDLSSNVSKIYDDKNTLNPYIWMDPLKVRIIAQNILDSLIKIDASNTRFYIKNHEIFIKRLDLIFLSIKEKYYQSSDSVFVLDAYWQYYLDAFELDFYVLEKKVLDASEVNSFRYKANLNKTKSLIISKGFNYNIAKSISSSANNAKIVEHDVYTYDWGSNIIALTNKILNIKDKKDNKNMIENKEKNEK